MGRMQLSSCLRDALQAALASQAETVGRALSQLDTTVSSQLQTVVAG